MNKIYKILGKRGRITIPLEIRQKIGVSYNDIVSFQVEEDEITVKQEKLCDDCKSRKKSTSDVLSNDTVSLLELLDSLSQTEQRAALIHLSVKWAQMQGEDNDIGE